MIDVETFARPITAAARYVRRHLPTSNSIELADLVQVGWERVTRYLSGADSTSTTLVFVTAKQGMFEAAAKWAGNAWADAPGTVRGKWSARRRVGAAPRITGIQEWHRSHSLDVELLIDIKRAILALPMREAASWYSRHVLDDPVGTLGPEFGVSRGRICQYEMAARAKLREAVEAGEPMRRSGAGILGTPELKRARVERERYAELRRKGASVKQATRGSKSPTCFAAALRQLTNGSNVVPLPMTERSARLREQGQRPLAKCGAA